MLLKHTICFWCCLFYSLYLQLHLALMCFYCLHCCLYVSDIHNFFKFLLLFLGGSTAFQCVCMCTRVSVSVSRDCTAEISRSFLAVAAPPLVSGKSKKGGDFGITSCTVHVKQKKRTPARKQVLSRPEGQNRMDVFRE